MPLQRPGLLVFAPVCHFWWDLVPGHHCGRPAVCHRCDVVGCDGVEEGGLGTICVSAWCS